MNHSSALKHSSGGNSSAWFLLNGAERDRKGPKWAKYGCAEPLYIDHFCRLGDVLLFVTVFPFINSLEAAVYDLIWTI